MRYGPNDRQWIKLNWKTYEKKEKCWIENENDGSIRYGQQIIS